VVEEDLPGRVDEDGAEDGDDPVEAMHQRHAGEDQRAAQDDGAQHAPEEDAVLVPRRDGEALEEQDEDEEVVDRERLLQQVAGEELQPLLAAVAEPDEEAEAHREDDPEDAPAQRLLEGGAGVAGGDLEVDREQQEDAEQEGDPQARAVDVAGARVGEGEDHLPAPPAPRGVERLLIRKTSRTGTWSPNRSRKRFTRKRR